MNRHDRRETMEAIGAKYAERAKAVLMRIADDLREYELTVSPPSDQSDDYPRWTMFVEPHEPEGEGVDVAFNVIPSEEGGEDNGVTFGVDITSVEGCMIGGLTPYNFSDQVWVPRDDPDAVEERFALIERAETSEAAYLVAKFYGLED